MSNSKPYVINKLTNKTAEVLIYDQIGESFFDEGITAKQFVTDLNAIGEVRRIDVRINSPGGSVFEGLAIFNALSAHSAQVVVHIDGIALSMASVIAAAGDVVNIAANGLVMVHNPRVSASGDVNDMRATVQLLEKAKAGLLKAYGSKVSISNDEMSELMDNETWMTPEEALSFGLVDHVTGAMNVAARVNLDDLPYGLCVPSDVRSKLSNGDIKTMSNDTKTEPQAVQPATLDELKAMNGADAEFILAQLEAKATPLDAMNALNAKLADELRVARTEQQEQPKPKPAASDAPKETPPADPAPKKQEPATDATEGAAPVASSNPKPNTPKAPAAEGEDMFAFIQAKFRENIANGMSADDAISAVHRDHPQTLAAVTPTK